MGLSFREGKPLHLIWQSFLEGFSNSTKQDKNTIYTFIAQTCLFLCDFIQVRWCYLLAWKLLQVPGNWLMFAFYSLGILAAGSWSLAAGWCLLDPGSWLLVGICWLLVPGCWLVFAGSLLLVAVCWILVPGYWLVFAGSWLLVAVCWILVPGY